MYVVQITSGVFRNILSFYFVKSDDISTLVFLFIYDSFNIFMILFCFVDSRNILAFSLGCSDFRDMKHLTILQEMTSQ